MASQDGSLEGMSQLPGLEWFVWQPSLAKMAEEKAEERPLRQSWGDRFAPPHPAWALLLQQDTGPFVHPALLHLDCFLAFSLGITGQGHKLVKFFYDF